MINQFSCEYCNATIPMQDKTILSCPKCNNPCWPSEVKALARSNKIAAIKVYRFVTNSGLKEAKDAVDGLSAKGFLALPSNFSMPQAPAAQSPAAQSSSPSLEQELMAFIKKGELIQAIKHYRQITYVGLKEAKDVVEALRDGRPVTFHPPYNPTATQEAPQSTDVREQVIALVKQGQSIEAIKLYREKTGVSLLEAKDAIDAVKAGRPLSINLISEKVAPAIPTGAHDEIMGAIKAGNKIVAIKLYRDQTGLGLKECKDEIDSVAAGHKQLSLPGFANPAPAAQVDDNEPFRAELLAMMKNEGFIAGIRLYRERTGVGLKEGKDFIEALEQDPKAPFPKI